MKPLLRTLAVLSLFFCLAADDKKDDGKADRDGMVGTWDVISFRNAKGQIVPKKGFLFVITPDTITTKSFGKVLMTMKYTLDAAQDPKQIDLTFEEDGKTRKLSGVYALKGDILRLRWSPEGEARPADLGNEGLFVLGRLGKPGK